MNFFLENTKSGTDLIVQTIKELLYNETEDIFDYLNFEDDNIYLEPLLFSYFNYKNISSWGLNQIIWGYIDERKRPARISVVSNNDGFIYLPNYGYLKTDCQRETIWLYWKEENAFLTNETGSIIPYHFYPLIILEKCGVEVVSFSNELTSILFTDESGKNVNVETLNGASYLSILERSLSIIEQHNPAYFACFRHAVKKFYLYTGTPNSFAAISAHGMAFFNLQPGDSSIFFLDNIIHQCAHVIFNAISFEKERWFTVSPSTLMSTFTKDRNDSQELYGKYHGLFTQTNINTTLDKCIDSAIFKEDELHELLGRFSSNMSRFSLALAKLNHAQIYTDIGKKWFDFFFDQYNLLYEKRESLITSYKIDNQPYVFNYQIFKETNPIKNVVEI